MRLRRLTSLIVLQVLALAGPAGARARIDTVLMKRGDRVEGEIVRLEAANLTVRTIAFGTVEVDWPEITALVSPQLFEVERDDGARFVGHLDGSETVGVLVVTGANGQAVEIPLERVVGIDQRGASLWASRRGYVDLGSTFSQAESDSNLSVAAELALKGRYFRWVNSLEATVSDDANDVQRQREVLQSRLEIPMGKRLLLLAGAQHERNDDLGLDARDTASGLVAWVPVNGARARVMIGPGIAESRESYASRPDDSTVTSAAVLAAGEYHTFGRFGTRVGLSVLWLPVLSGPERERVEVRAAFRQKLGSDFTISVSPYYSYDSRPPAPEDAGEDWGWVTSVGLMF